MTDQTNGGVNIPLLRKAVEWAEAEAAKPLPQSEWDQGAWVAQPDEVAYRVARLELGDLNHERFQDRLAALTPECGTAYCIAGWVMREQGWSDDMINRDPESDAAEHLGIDYESSQRLFALDNTIEDVRRIAESLAGERL